jgi:tRNA(fMet)-specific endonuclease VapC
MLASDPNSIVTCSIVKAELFYGARKSQRVDANLLAFDRMLAPFRSLPFDDIAAAHYGLIRTSLELAGTPIGGNDLMISAIAIAHDCRLITRNTREYIRVPGLKLESWD